MVGKIIGLVLAAVALFYIFKKPSQTAKLLQSVGTVGVDGVTALQGGYASGKVSMTTG